jgi:hypothetical protein
MTVYIEYAFLQNFVFDGVLFTLALLAYGERLCLWRIALSSALGGIFAILFPLVKLPVFLNTLLKFAGGALLCMPLVKRLKTGKEWGRYACICLFFYAFTFLFGGGLLGIYNAPVAFWKVLLGFGALSVIGVFLIRKLYERRILAKNTCPCRVFNGDKSIKTNGFIDSGNLAQKNGLPVCFLAPDLFYELFGEEILNTRGQVCEELAIATLAGGKTVSLYEGEIELDGVKKRAYFAVSAHMLSREYQLLFNPALFEEWGAYENH